MVRSLLAAFPYFLLSGLLSLSSLGYSITVLVLGLTCDFLGLLLGVLGTSADFLIMEWMDSKRSDPRKIHTRELSAWYWTRAATCGCQSDKCGVSLDPVY